MRSGAGIYCVLAGVFMAGWWAVDLSRGPLQRADRSRTEMGLHVAVELLTAALLIAGGGLLIAGGNRGLALAGLGMLLYSVINSPGYFLARHELAPAAMFAVLAALTSAAIAILVA